ncbi:MAG: alpha-mannosidase [Omnitrophica WOR_2 bacterium]
MQEQIKPSQQLQHASVVSHTHWDRAWYVSFQEFRARLVRLVDRLFDLLDRRPEYRVYTLDGQMAVLEDYLEVRASQADRLKAFCRSGRIQVGPWYVLSDEFLVSPEALIRNMQLGHAMGIDYGGVTKIGYVPDGFGHIAQLPQILRGFGIDNVFFWRGLGNEGEQLGSEFEWRAPDGSAVTAVWMPFGYHNISNIGYPIHWGDTSQMEFSMDLAMAQIRKAMQALKPFAHTPALLLMNGIDHAEAEPRLPDILECARREFPDIDFKQATLQDHLKNIRSAGKKLPAYEGEFRWGRYSEILQGVYATRIYLKQANQSVETLLERYTEPLAAMAWLSGAKVPAGTQDLIWTGWRWLLKNHPHDDIYGSGIDIVHDEMMYRFSQAEQIGRLVLRDSLRQLARQVDFTAQAGTPVLVYNPLSWDRREIAAGEIDFDFDDPAAGNFYITDSQGNPFACQVLAEEPAFWMETLKPNRKRRVKVAFPAEIPACGYRAFYVQPGTFGVKEAENPNWKISENGAENRFLAFQIQPDGSLDVTHKDSGQTYKGLHMFVDVEDAGDEYSYCPCEHSQVFSTSGGRASIQRIVDGPYQATFRVIASLALPEGLAEDRQHRSERLLEMPVTSDITLYRDQPGLYIRTELDNRARDHKLSVVFPTGLNPAQCSVDESFLVIQRDIDLPDSKGWVEDPAPMMHQRAFTDISEGKIGLAILNRGLPAVEVTRRDEGVQVSLVLLRSVGWLSRDDLSTRRVAAGPLVPTPGAQCIGRFSFEYAILPHAGGWQEVFPPAYEYIAPLLVARADTHEGLNLNEMNITRDDPSLVRAVPWPRGGPLPDKLSFIRLKPERLIVSALKRSEDGQRLVLRFYNSTREKAAARLETGIPLRAAVRLNLNEEHLEDLPLAGENRVELEVRPAEIVTLGLQFIQ